MIDAIPTTSSLKKPLPRWVWIVFASVCLYFGIMGIRSLVMQRQLLLEQHDPEGMDFLYATMFANAIVQVVSNLYCVYGFFSRREPARRLFVFLNFAQLAGVFLALKVTLEMAGGEAWSEFSPILIGQLFLSVAAAIFLCTPRARASFSGPKNSWPLDAWLTLQVLLSMSNITFAGGHGAASIGMLVTEAFRTGEGFLSIPLIPVAIIGLSALPPRPFWRLIAGAAGTALAVAMIVFFALSGHAAFTALSSLTFAVAAGFRTRYQWKDRGLAY